jgi:hypothetical protein
MLFGGEICSLVFPCFAPRLAQHMSLVITFVVSNILYQSEHEKFRWSWLNAIICTGPIGAQINRLRDRRNIGIGTAYRQARPEKVGRVGIEPTTPGLKVRCSAELS